MKSFWIGGTLGFILGAALTFLYFSLATLFSVHKKLAVETSDSMSQMNDHDSCASQCQSESAKGVGA